MTGRRAGEFDCETIAQSWGIVQVEKAIHPVTVFNAYCRLIQNTVQVQILKANVSAFIQNRLESELLAAAQLCHLVPFHHEIPIWSSTPGAVINFSGVEIPTDNQVIPENRQEIIRRGIHG